MHLEQLIIRSFRAFREATIDFPQSGLLLLAGANNAGKSSTLAALDLVARGASPTSPQHLGGGPASITARFGLDDHDRSVLEEARVTTSTDWVSGFATHAEWEFSLSSRMPVSAVVLRIRRNDGEAFDFERRYFRGFNLVVERRNLNDGALREVSSSGSHEKGSLSAPDIRNLLALWRRGYFHFPAVRGAGDREYPLQADSVLAATGDNLAAVLLHLKMNQASLWDRLRETITAILPGVGDLELSANGRNQSVTFVESTFPEHRHNLRDLGGGVEQILLAAVVGIAQPQARFVAIEEPETALHPAAQRAMAALLKRWSHDRVIALTTHSPIFLDQSGPHASTYVVRRSAGVSTVEPADSRLVEALDALGVRTSDVLSAERILLVEGRSDRDTLAAWWPQLVEDPRIAVIIGQGGRNVWHSDLLGDWMAEADRLDRPVLYLRDHDELDAETVEKLKSRRTVHVLERREIENYLLDPAALVAYFADRGAQVSADDVEQAMRAAADSLRVQVVVKSVAQRIGAGQRLIDDRLRSHLAKTVADADAMVGAVLPQVISPQEVEGRIRDEWARAEAEISRRWAEDWVCLAPGDEVLRATFQHFLKRGYQKTTDAGDLARCLSEPPGEIRRVIEDFLRE